MFEADELFARGAGPGAGGLGFLDPAPIVIVGRHHPATCQQALETLGARTLAAAASGQRGGDLVGDLVAVRAVGADGAARPAPRPADGVKALGDAAAVILFGVVGFNECIAPIILRIMLIRSGEAGKKQGVDFAAGH